MTQGSLGTVYFVRCPANGLIKIGWTGGPPNWRLRNLRAMSPMELEPLGALPGRDVEERELHERFAALRHHGEWFMPGDALMTFVAAHVLPWPGDEAIPASPAPTAWRREEPPADQAIRGIFRQQYHRRDGTRAVAKKWYGQYQDERGISRRVPLHEDRDVAEAMLRNLRERARRREARRLSRPE